MEFLTGELLEIFVEKLLEEEEFALFAAEKNLTSEDIAKILLKVHRTPIGKPGAKTKEKLAKVEVSKEDLVKMVNVKYKTNWQSDEKHCIFCYGANVFEGAKPFSYCSAELKQGEVLFCDEHRSSKKSIKIVESYNYGQFDLETYHAKNDALRKTSCENKLKKIGFDRESLKDMSTRELVAFREYSHNNDYLYDKKNGLIVKRIDGDIKRNYKTIGIDRRNTGKIKKLTADDIRIYKNVAVSFDKNSLSEEAMEFLGI